MPTFDGVGRSEFKDASVSTTDFPFVTSNEQLIRTGMFTPRSFVNVTTPGGTSTYYILDDGKTLWDMDTKASTSLDKLRGRVMVSPTPQARIVNAETISGQVASRAYKGLRKSEGVYEMQLSQHGRALSQMKEEVSKIQGREGKAIREMLKQANAVQARIVSSIDFETAVSTSAASKSEQMAITGGFASVIDYRFKGRALGGSTDNVPGMNEFGYMRAEGSKYFDLQTVSGWQVGSRVEAKNLIDRITKEGQILKGGQGRVGIENVFEFYDSVRETHNRRIEGQIRTEVRRMRQAPVRSAERQHIKGTIGTLRRSMISGESLTRIASRSRDEAVERFTNIAHRMKDIVSDTLSEARKQIGQTGQDKAKVGTILQEAYSIVEGTAHSGTVRGGAQKMLTEKSIYLTEDVVLNVAQDVINAYNKGKGQTTLAFGAMESQVFNAARMRLEESLKAGTVPSSQIDMVKENIGVLEEASNRLNDLQFAGKALIQQRIDMAQSAMKSSRHLMYETLLRFGVDENLASKVYNEMTDNFINSYQSGTSLENMLNVLGGKEVAEFKHTGYADSLTASNLGKLLMKDENEILRVVGEEFDPTFGEYEAPMRKGQFYRIDRGTMSKFSIANRMAIRMRSAEAAALFQRHASDEQLGKLMGQIGNQIRAGGNLAPKGSQSATFGLSNKVRSSLDRAFYDKAEQVAAAAKDFADGSFEKSLHSSPLSANTPSLLSHMFKARTIGSLAALKMASWFDHWLQPAEVDDHGKHASLETVARRIGTTEFNSRVVAGMIPKVLRKIPQWLRRTKYAKEKMPREGIITTETTPKIHVNPNERWLLDSLPEGKTVEGYAQKLPTFKTLHKSAQKRAEAVGERIDDSVNEAVKSRMGYNPKLRKFKQEFTELEQEQHLKQFDNYIQNQPYSHFDMKARVEGHMLGLRGNKQYHYPATNKHSTAVNPDEAQEMVLAGHTFSTYGTPTSRFMEYFSQTPPTFNIARFSKWEYGKESQKLMKSEMVNKEVMKRLKSMDDVIAQPSLSIGKPTEPPVMARVTPFKKTYAETSKVDMSEAYKGKPNYDPVQIPNPGRISVMQHGVVDTMKNNDRMVNFIPQNLNMAKNMRRTLPVVDAKDLPGGEKGFLHVVEAQPTQRISPSLRAPHHHVQPVGASPVGMDHHDGFTYMMATGDKRNLYPGSKMPGGAGRPGTAAGLRDITINTGETGGAQYIQSMNDRD